MPDRLDPLAAAAVFASAKVSIFSSGLNTAITLLVLYSMLSASSATDAPAATANIDASVSAALTRQITA